MTLSICLEETREDEGPPGEPGPSEGGEGGLDVNMGERRKKRLCCTTLACIYMHITEESGSPGYGPGPGPYDTVHGTPIVKLGRPGQPAR
jgi:hypothetical protein